MASLGHKMAASWQTAEYFFNENILIFSKFDQILFYMVLLIINQY